MGLLIKDVCAGGGEGGFGIFDTYKQRGGAGEIEVWFFQTSNSARMSTKNLTGIF